MINILQNQEFVNLDDYFSNEIYGRIYKITNLINGKIYIGQTTKSIKERFKGHIKLSKNYSKSNQYIHKAINKYGVENFTIEEIDIAYSLDDLNQKEYGWIVKENCLAPNGYNIKPGGNQKGFLEETKQKISKNTKGKKRSKEFIEKQKQNRLGKKLSEETKQKIRDSNLGQKRSDDICLKISNAKKGKKVKGSPKSESHKQKLRDVNLGKKLSEETKQKISSSNSGRILSETTRLKMSLSRKNKKLSEETKEKISETSKNRHKGKIWYYNPENNDSIMIFYDEQPPEGFIRGRGNMKTNRTVYFHNPETQTEIRINMELEFIPEGFIRGRLKIVNNNIDS